MEDKQIIELLFARDELGLKMTEEKYNKLYRSILRQALQDPADIDECANDVLMGVWNSIPPHYPNHFPSYICRIARRIGINRFKHNTRQKRNVGCHVVLSELEGCISAPDKLAQRQEAIEFQELLNRFLLDLDPQSRVLFIRRYFYGIRTTIKKFAADSFLPPLRAIPFIKDWRAALFSIFFPVPTSFPTSTFTIITCHENCPPF